LRDIQKEFHLTGSSEEQCELFPVHSVKGVHDRHEQPGMVTFTDFKFDNPHATQPLQFILQAAGKAGIDGLLLEIEGREVFSLSEPLAAGQILRYSGGDTVVRCNPQGVKLESFQVNAGRFRVDPGNQRIHVGGRFTGLESPSVKCEFRTVGPPRRLSAR
jgi:hypothetical protein